MCFVKKSLLFIALLATHKSQAQTYHGWKLGICGGPLHYWYYNKGLINSTKDFARYGNTSPYFKQNNTKAINGFSIGICTEKNYKRKWTIRTELTYNHQIQAYLGSSITIDKTPILNFTIRSNFSHIKLPIMIGYQIPLNKRKTISLQLNQGIQLSYLQKYELKGEGNYDWPIKIVNSNNDTTRITVGAKQTEKLYGRNFDHKIDYVYYFEINNQICSNWPYRRFVLGTITDIGLKGQLPLKLAGFEHWYYSASMRFEYDFISSDANNYDNRKISSFLGTYPHTNHKTHNIRAGLNFSLMYHFNKR